MPKEIRGLKAWVKRISTMELPSLGNVLRDLNRMTEDTEANVEELADVILKDAALTSQVLRVANSVQYNPAAHTITTISRAVILIGFAEIKAISMSVMVIDALLGKNPKGRLLELIARSFHAAVQAKNIASKLDQESQEEVFIAALLFHLGEMAFLGCDGEQVDEYIRRMDLNPGEQADICMDVLGVGFKTITKELAKEWDLGPLIINALEKPDSPDSKVAAVIMGDELAQSVAFGWESREIRQLVHGVSQFTGLEPPKAEELILASADEAAAVATLYGAEQVCHLLPDSGSLTQKEPESGLNQQQLQLKYLHELTDLMLEKANLNRIFVTLVQGLNKGAGLARVAVALFDMDRTHLEARYMAGQGTSEWRKVFRMPVIDMDRAGDAFSAALKSAKPLWLGPDKKMEALRYHALRNVLPVGDCFIGPMSVMGRNIGVIYADANGQSLDDQDFEHFQLFLKQAQIALTVLVTKKNNQ